MEGVRRSRRGLHIVFCLFKMLKIRKCLNVDGNNLIESKSLMQADALKYVFPV